MVIMRSIVPSMTDGRDGGRLERLQMFGGEQLVEHEGRRLPRVDVVQEERDARGAGSEAAVHVPAKESVCLPMDRPYVQRRHDRILQGRTLEGHDMPVMISDPHDVARGLVKAAQQARPFVVRQPDPHIVTDEFVTAWIDDVSALLDAARSAPLTELGPDHSRFENVRSRLTKFVGRFQRAPWLSESTRAKVSAFVAACPPYVSSRYRLTYDCFSSRIPQWEIDLARFKGKPDLRVLEIGSFEGHCSCWLLENILTHESARLTCVDRFDGGAKDLFDHNIDLTGARAKVEAIAGESRTILPRLTQLHYDFIYVDASHDQVGVLEDSVLAWRLLKPGGLMTFDDYGLKDVPVLQAVMTLRPDIGIDAFLSVYDGRYRIVSRGFQVTIEKLLERVPPVNVS
jgi:hypothetical protein